MKSHIYKIVCSVNFVQTIMNNWNCYWTVFNLYYAIKHTLIAIQQNLDLYLNPSTIYSTGFCSKTHGVSTIVETITIVEVITGKNSH